MNAMAGPYADADALADHWWWRPGWHVGTRFYTWHLTIQDHPELQALVHAYQALLNKLSTVDIVPTEWLHITTQGVGHVNDVPDDQREAILRAVSHRLAAVAPVRATFQRPVLHREAVVIPPIDPAPFAAVRHAIRDGIADAWGGDRVPESAEGFRPHVSAGYINAPSDPASVRGLLNSIDPAPVTITLHTASLIALHRDQRMYQWTTVATAPIGRAR
jgi:2'-5' RNA ligase superfamily protein